MLATKGVVRIPAKVIQEDLFKSKDPTEDISSLESSAGVSDAQKPIYLVCAPESPNSYPGFWRLLRDDV